jgi:hypothetical protein
LQADSTATRARAGRVVGTIGRRARAGGGDQDGERTGGS